MNNPLNLILNWFKKDFFWQMLLIFQTSSHFSFSFFIFWQDDEEEQHADVFCIFFTERKLRLSGIIVEQALEN